MQSYAVATFLTLLGPTAVRVVDESDVEAYLDDADRARDEGSFSAMLANPAVQLADVGALGDHTPQDGPSLRLYVDVLGDLRLSPAGEVLAWTESLWTSSAPGAGGALTTIGSSQAALDQRPWLPRYLSAVRAVQSAVARGHQDLSVSGFGRRLAEDCPLRPDDFDLAHPQAPIVLWDADTHLVYLPPSGRTFVADVETATSLERVLRDPDAAGPEPWTTKARNLLNGDLGHDWRIR